MGLPKTALCVYVLELYIFYAVPHIQAGHVYMPKDVLIEHTVYTLKVTDDEVIAAVSELLSSKELFQDKDDGIDAYYLYSYYESEYYIARLLIAMSQTRKIHNDRRKSRKSH